jgi:hypothetical protein
LQKEPPPLQGWGAKALVASHPNSPGRVFTLPSRFSLRISLTEPK